MKHYDNNIEMFDAYLNNLMDDNDKKSFEESLSQDPALKQEFKNHKEMVFLLQQTSSDANQEFEKAMRKIPDEDFKNIVSGAQSDRTPEAKKEEKKQERMVPLKKVYQWMGIAALVAIIAGVGYHMIKSNSNQTTVNTNQTTANQELTRQDDGIKIKACCNMLTQGREHLELLASRGGDDDLEMEIYNDAIKNLKDNNVEEAIQGLLKIYNDTPNLKRKEDIATELAFAYVQAYDINNALRIIEEMKNANGGNLPPELKMLDKYLNTLDFK